MKVYIRLEYLVIVLCAAAAALLLSARPALAQDGAGVAVNGGATRAEATDSELLVDVQAVSAGGLHSCALTTGGGVKCWGANMLGQLGDGTLTGALTPVDVTGLASGIQAVRTGWWHTCALTAGGGVKCWGDNPYGELGDGTKIRRTTPVDVSGLSSGVQAISTRRTFTCALTSGGGVKCWGSNEFGQLGDGTTTDHTTPIDVSGLGKGITQVTAGYYHACALTTGGGVKCWGANWDGALGDGTTDNSPSPVDVLNLGSGVASISAGSRYTCALLTSGGVKCWGINSNGQVGDGSQTNRLEPTNVIGLDSGVLAIDASGGHTCAILSSGPVTCWGVNAYGQLGDGTQAAATAPVTVTALVTGVSSVSAGSAHSCALMTTGTLKCWGLNSSGALGDSTTTSRLTPVDVLAGFDISGRITLDGAGLPGVVVSAGNKSATTNANGEYVLPKLPPGTYTLTPSIDNMAFTPPSRDVSLPPSAANIDFAARTADFDVMLPVIKR